MVMSNAGSVARCPGRAGATPAAPRSRRGFTLLELLLAAALLASMSVLIGALLSQTRQWSEDTGDGGAAIRAMRAMEALREQWGDRRTAVGLNDEGASVVLAPGSLRFVTARPLLFPDWPLAAAEYRIEEDFESQTGQGRLWRLVYLESRITSMKPAAEDAADPTGRPRTERAVLLSACESLAWERRAMPRQPAADEESAAEAQGAAGKPGDAGSAAPASSASASSSAEPSRIEWRAVEGESSKDLSMIRLAGRKKGEAFSCVLVARASR